MAHDKIIIKGAREHNLKNINLEIPRDKMVVFTGFSGSGKSSLAFDTIFAEGQRRYIESLSAYARQFLGRLDKPDVDDIEGLSPAISIDQKSHSANPRSTVATITEIYDYLRVLFARAGKPFCPKCGREIQKMTNEEIVDVAIDIANENSGAKGAKNEHGDLGACCARPERGILPDALRLPERRVLRSAHRRQIPFAPRADGARPLQDAHDRACGGPDAGRHELQGKGQSFTACRSDRVRAQIRRKRRHDHHRQGSFALGEVHLPARRIFVPGDRTAALFVQQSLRRLPRMPRPGHEGPLVGRDMPRLRGEAPARGKLERFDRRQEHQFT